MHTNIRVYAHKVSVKQFSWDEPRYPIKVHIECVPFLLLKNVFSYYRMCSLAVECVLLLQNVFAYNECVLF